MNESIIDVNVNLSRWPTRRVPLDETQQLVEQLATHAVTQAWVGSLDGLLHKDIAAVNARLAAECAAVRELEFLPFGSINPSLPDWQEDVRRCAEVHHMRGVRLHPNYHGYTLDQPQFAELLKLCEARQLVVTLPIQMEDERVMHPLLRVKPVDITPLKSLLPRFPNLKMVLINAGKALAINQIAPLARTSHVYTDIANLDGLAVMEEVVRDMPLERILFGSHSPVFTFESAVLKLKEAELTQSAAERIRFTNAQRCLTDR